VYWWHSQYHQCHHESQSLHRICLARWLEPPGHPEGLGKYRSLLLGTHSSSSPPPPLLLPPLTRWGGCSRGSELHPDWWWRCPPERWGGQSNRLSGWGSPAPHRTIVGDNPSWCRHGAFNGCPSLRSWLRSLPKASFQLDLLGHLCGSEAFTRRVSFVPHGLISGVQRAASAAHNQIGVTK
jgi:hypothetical protein